MVCGIKGLFKISRWTTNSFDLFIHTFWGKKRILVACLVYSWMGIWKFSLAFHSQAVSSRYAWYLAFRTEEQILLILFWVKTFLCKYWCSLCRPFWCIGTIAFVLSCGYIPFLNNVLNMWAWKDITSCSIAFSISAIIQYMPHGFAVFHFFSQRA